PGPRPLARAPPRHSRSTENPAPMPHAVGLHAKRRRNAFARPSVQRQQDGTCPVGFLPIGRARQPAQFGTLIRRRLYPRLPRHAPPTSGSSPPGILPYVDRPCESCFCSSAFSELKHVPDGGPPRS